MGPGTFSLSARSGFLRLYRQRESDFTYCAKMAFTTHSSDVEAGISLFQKDDNYINCTVARSPAATSSQSSWLLRLSVKEKDKEVQLLKEEAMDGYAGEIQFEVKSTGGKYYLGYSVDGGSRWVPFSVTEADLIISTGYTGACLGLYCTSNGKSVTADAYADFDWIQHNASPRMDNANTSGQLLPSVLSVFGCGAREPRSD